MQLSMTENAALEVIRAFVAISVPTSLLREVGRVQRQLLEEIGGNTIRWTRPEQMHLTLRFLGNVERSRLEEIQNALTAALVTVPPFRLTLEGIGCFPSSRKPNVIWVGLAGDLDVLQRVQQSIGEEIAPFASHCEERRFHPHLTLGRVKTRNARNLRVAGALEKMQIKGLGNWTVDAVELIQSKLSPQGSQYTRLSSVGLVRLNPAA